jgi:trk system potassium uptake protein TrkH
MVRKASAILVISLGLVVSATFALTVSHDVTLDRAVFEVISAFATCGLTLAFTDKLSVFGQLVICAVMAWGRLGALTILFALTRNDRVERVQYPEERILIG